jgi:hypothetical protein
MRLDGRRRRAALWYLRSLTARRELSDLGRAAATLLGDRALALGRRALVLRPSARPAWIPALGPPEPARLAAAGLPPLPAD